MFYSNLSYLNFFHISNNQLESNFLSTFIENLTKLEYVTASNNDSMYAMLSSFAFGNMFHMVPHG